jgi:hypothetical protein
MVRGESVEVPNGHYFAKVMLGDGSIVSGYTLTQAARVVDTTQTYQLVVDGKPETRVLQQLILDTASNSDNIWYAADTTVMDAGHADVLKYFGIPMTGGDANGGLAGFAIYNGLFGAAIGLGNLLRYGTGEAQGWEDEIYVDHIQPWILYGFKADEDGRSSTGVRGTAARSRLDMYITNAFDQIFRGLMAAIGAGEPAPADGINKGWMKIENVDVVGSRLGIFQHSAANQVLSNGKSVRARLSGGQASAIAGSLNMVFRAVNPLQVLLPILAAQPGLIGKAMYYSVFADALVSSVEAMTRFAKSLAWAEGSDPLVIDLDAPRARASGGCVRAAAGIETIGLSNSKAYFDVDGDLFAERTGWLKGDDGFLVLDANGNGRVDGIGEMFGNRSQGGFAELAGYDSNGDGKITVGDLIWSQLQVWQDRDRDGQTDAGELKSLAALGIVELSFNAETLNATTPQGAELLSRAAVKFGDGRVSSVYEAIFNANDVDTKYAGEAGLAPWQTNGALNAKGFFVKLEIAA